MVAYPDSDLVPWDLALKDYIDGFADRNGFVFDPLHPDFGAVGDGTTDDTDAVQAAVAAASAADGWVVLRQAFLVNDTITQDNSFGIVGLGGLGGLIAGPSMPSGQALLFTGVTGSTPSDRITQGHLFGWAVCDVWLWGNARTVACKGWNVELMTAGTVRNVNIRHFAQEGFRANTSARETDFSQVHVRGCGDLGNGYPAVNIAQSTSADAHNNVVFRGLKSIYPFGIGVSIMCTDETSPTRNITFEGGMFHGFTPATAVTDEGEVLTPDWRCVGAPMVQVADAQTVTFEHTRIHRSGYGQPLILIRDNPNSSSTKNTLTMSDTSWGLPQHQTGTFTANATTDQCTFTGGQLGTGAMIRFTTTTTLPAGLSLLTDYYAIRVDDNTFKVATTRANAEAGTNIDITTAGTGTHTVTTQDFFALIEAATGQTDVVMRGGRATEDCTNVRAAICNKAGDGDVQVSDFSPASTLAKVYEPFSATDYPTQLQAGTTAVLPVRVVKKVLETRVNNTTTIDAELLLNLTPGMWKVQGWLQVDGSTTGDFNVQWFSSQASWTGGIQFEGQATSATVNVGSQFNQVAARGTTVGRGMIGVGTPLGIPFAGVITVDVAGQFQIRWAQNTTDGSNATTIYAGSWVEAAQLA